MRHLDRSQFPDTDRRCIFLAFLFGLDVIPGSGNNFRSKFIFCLIIQLHNTPDSAAEQPIILSRIFFADRNILQTKVREFRFIHIIADIQAYRNLINYCITSSLPENRQDFLCFIWADKVICQNVLHIFHPLLNNFRIIRTAILSQQKFQHINRNICTFLDFLGQILADNLAVKILAQFLFDDLSPIFGFHEICQ